MEIAERTAIGLSALCNKNSYNITAAIMEELETQHLYHILPRTVLQAQAREYTIPGRYWINRKLEQGKNRKSISRNVGNSIRLPTLPVTSPPPRLGLKSLRIPNHVHARLCCRSSQMFRG